MPQNKTETPPRNKCNNEHESEEAKLRKRCVGGSRRLRILKEEEERKGKLGKKER